MTDVERKRLFAYYRSLNAVERNLRDHASRTGAYGGDAGDAIAEEIDRLESEFPALGPLSRVKQMRLQSITGDFYPTEALLTKVSLTLGKLGAALEEDTSSRPVTEAKEFPFVHASELRKILERDYLEIQRSYVAQCWKSAIILAGGAIEAILLDLVLQDPTKARLSQKAPNHSDPTRWDLGGLIAVCVDLKLVTSGVERLSSPVRDYRNLVHPGNELRSKLVFGAQEARIALEVLNIVHRDLS